MLTSDIICLGDFNVDVGSDSRLLLKLVTDFSDFVDLIQLINTPTRITDNTATILDLILVSSSLITISSGTVDTTGMTDHLLVQCEVKFTTSAERHKLSYSRNLSSIPLDLFNEVTESKPWNDIFTLNDIDEKVSLLSNLILELFDEFAPLKPKSSQTSLPWVTREVRGLMRTRDHLRAKLKRCCDVQRRETLKSNYDDVRRQVLTLMRINEEIFFADFLELPVPKRWAKLGQIGIKPPTASLPAAPPFLDPNCINDHFIDSIPALETTIPDEPPAMRSPNIPTFEFRPISELDLFNAVRSVKLTSAADDDISGKMFLFCLPFCFVQLTHIINQSLTTAIFPSAWKKGLTVPLPKVSSPTSLSELRPITLLPFVSKIIEKLVQLQVQNFLDTHHLLPAHQSGFRVHHSTTTALSLVADDALRAYDAGKVSLLRLLDFSKAFDTLSHSKLLYKLKAFNFGDDSINWFSFYLSDRSQATVLNTAHARLVSDRRTSSQGVPQGSILGPLCINLYVADLLDLDLKSIAKINIFLKVANHPLLSPSSLIRFLCNVVVGSFRALVA
ncbi:uncharacterized protein LOC112904505 [Agrilus planipennis]|uniref:Uncharacterized protein LOC112904505 n=1 Tax=Agrilus planipennis TaxID=224129 RepID=A0A7F5R3X5_AGRPL|nr:uncharacterized protein LOC112904505 [Agrilus planipennis]